MNKILRIGTIFLVLVIFSFTKAQSQIYLNLGTGYGFKLASQNIDYLYFQDQTLVDFITTTDRKNVSLGKGINVDAAVGYNFTKNLAFEVEVSYLFGTKSKVTHEDIGESTTDYSLKSRMLKLIPSIVLSTGSGTLEPYAKFGLVVGRGSFRHEMVRTDIGGGNSTEVTKFKGSIAIGFSSEFGFMYNFSDNLSLFGGLNIISMSYSPKKAEIIESTDNGEDQLPNMDKRDKEIEFMKSIDSGFYPTADVPRQELKQKFPFSSIGFNIGLRIKL